MPTKHLYNLGLAFSEVARQYAGRPALRYPSGAEVSYRRLEAQSNRIGGLLQKLTIKRGDVVCLLNHKSVESLASMLACLKLGAVYTNLDLTSPARRIGRMLDCCRPNLVLHDGAPTELLGEAEARGARTLNLLADEFSECIASECSDELEVGRSVTGSDPAYIMFTSGSTGFPKGAVMTHQNVLNFIQWGREILEVTPEDIFTNVNPIYFDNSVFDFYTSLFSGAALCPVTSDIAAQPRELVRCINRLGCTIWFSVPSLLVYLLTTRSLKADDFPSITRFVFGGEGFPKGKLKDLYELFGQRARLVNVYGPTECTCICSSYEITREDVEDLSRLAPLGLMAPNFSCHIEPLDPKEPDFGELYLGGPNVGSGYYNDPERTQQAFVQDPRQNRFWSVFYRTGDLVHRAENGYLHFKGRADNQIKHAGYRIELEEIEAAFNSLAWVNEVGVVYRKDESGLGQIVAFLHCAEEVSENEVRDEIRELVPPYMVPRKIRLMRTPLPKNRNGKIDRQRLKGLLKKSLVGT